MSELSTADIDDLPDSAFAYIEPGGDKDDEGKTTPRSLRHFPIADEAHVRDALSRAPQSPFGDKAMPDILKAAKKMGIQVSGHASESVDDVPGSVAHAWHTAVCQIVRESAGADADLLLDSFSFWDTHLTEAAEYVEDPDDPGLREVVEAAVLAAGGIRATESRDIRLESRVIEALGTTADGSREYDVRLLKYGDSKNGRRYTRKVMEAAAPKYEGAPAYDHHRTADELRTSTIHGMVGRYSGVQAREDGLYARLTLLPSASHAAEALDASIAAQAAGGRPLVGLSHDVMADFRPVAGPNGRHLQEATLIRAVQSADVVADPSAGGHAVRALAGGTDPGMEIDSTEDDEGDEVTTTEAVLDALRGASDEQLSEVGLNRVAPASTSRATEAAGEARDSITGRLLIHTRLNAAGITGRAAESVMAILPERVTEASVSEAIEAYRTIFTDAERAALRPTVTATVTVDERDRKTEAVDAMIRADYRKGYHSLREAFLDFTGFKPDRIGGEDLNRRILRESIGAEAYDSTGRVTESIVSGTWAQALGDSITRRMIAYYNTPSLQTWKSIVSSTVPINDFRTQRLNRIGGYGVLPTVNQGMPYQPLTSPTNEESTYAISKRGGTEDVTLETIANDDLRTVQLIPVRLGRAAAQTLYRGVFDMLATNVTCTYDSTALFHTNHSNTTSGALGQTSLSSIRASMRAQTAYGDTKEVLGLTPKWLVIPTALEEIAYQLSKSAVAIPATPAGPTDTPNIHQGIDYIVVDYFSDADDWFAVCDPMDCPTIEVGFYQGREQPELFTQSDPNVGSMFNADTLTYKVRHIWGTTVVDHRGFQRSAQD